MNDTSITVLIVLGMLLVVAAVSYRIVKRIVSSHLGADAVKQQVIDKGLVAEAKVIEVWETGILIRHKPALGLRLKITPPGRTSYEAKMEIIATPMQVVQLQPGQTTRVYIDPNNPQNIVLK